jgi:hypothetical protein
MLYVDLMNYEKNDSRSCPTAEEMEAADSNGCG